MSPSTANSNRDREALPPCLKDGSMEDNVEIEVEKSYRRSVFVEKLRNLADVLEQKKPFVLRFGGERIRIPVDVTCHIEYERDGTEQEVEFQIKWSAD